MAAPGSASITIATATAITWSFMSRPSGLAVQLLNDQRSWSSVAIYTDSNGNPWQLSTYYTFKLVVVPQGGGVDALFGKVWLSGTAEPAQLDDRGDPGERPEPEPGPSRAGRGLERERRLRHGRLPAGRMASTGSLVWAVTPSLSPRSIPRGGSRCRVRGLRATECCSNRTRPATRTSG